MLFNSHTCIGFFLLVLAGCYLTRSWKAHKGTPPAAEAHCWREVWGVM
jgi:hypothetical protein